MAEQIVKVKVDLDVSEFNKNAKAMSDALSSILGKDIELFNGKIRKTKNALDETEQSFKKVENTIKNSGESVKKSSQQWTNLALVIQDLPFGFRGIQNNLPALIGGLAGVAGPIYLIGSAIIALATVYEKEMKAIFVTTSEAEKEQALYNNTLKESGTAYVDAQSQLLSLTEKVSLAKKGFLDKQSVVNEYNDTIGKTIGKQKDLEGVNQALINQGPAYVDYITKLSFAMTAAKLLAEASSKMIQISMKDTNEFIDGWDAFFSSKVSLTGGPIASFAASVQALTGIAKKARETQLGEAGKTAVGYQKIMKDAFVAVGEAAKKITLVPGADPETEKRLKEAAERRKKANEAETNAYIETLTKRGQEEYKAGLELAKNLQTMKAAGYTDSTTYYAAYRQNMLNIANKYDEEERAALEKKNADRAARQKEINGEVNAIVNRGLQNELDAIHIASQNGLKLSKGSRQGQIDALNKERDALLELKAASGWEPEQLDKINDALVRNSASLEVYTNEWVTTAQKVSDIVKGMISDTFVMFAESLGKVFSGQNVDIFGGLMDILGSGLEEIGKALISYGLAMEAFKTAFANPFAAVAAGFALVAAGSYLKASVSNVGSGNSTGVQAFANGGIISGPTMGLMGEYPGAQSNPEVVAPLDKLKEMIGGNGGGGTFVLRGQDLLVAVNRAQKASSLKGQNISLA